MDGTRFDRLTRAFARVGTRRQVVVGAAVVVVGVGGLEAADAKVKHPCRAGRQTCQRDNQCCSGTCRRGVEVPLKDRNRCACGDGETQCGNACVDLAHDERNCGACGTRCRTGDLCCPDGCVDTKTDEANCGACGHHCATGEVCAHGSCVDLATDPANCGAVGRACKSDSPCISGACDYRTLCVEQWDGDSYYCAYGSEDDVHMNPNTVAAKDADGATVYCMQDAECQFHPMCELDNVDCVCLLGDVWGTGPEDGGVYIPGDCWALYQESACSDPNAMPGYVRCNVDVDNTVWGSMVGDYRHGDACMSTQECIDADPLCSQPGYQCGCVYSFSYNGSLAFQGRAQCFRDTITV